MQRIRLAAAQLNLVVGDLDGNVERILAAMKAAEADDADLVALPELAITGYPPEDLLLKPGFVIDNREALDTVVARSGRCVAFVGFVDGDEHGLYNASAVCANGELLGVYHKRRLPNSDVFDEHRYFVPGDEPLRLYEIAGVPVGVSICEDAWSASGPILAQALGGAQLIVNINGSPYHADKLDVREQILAARATEAGCTIFYVNLVGGQDELVFDGASLVMAPNGTILTRAGQYTEELFVTDIEVDATGRERTLPVVDLSNESIATGPLQGGGARRTAPVGGRDLRRARTRHTRLRPQERVHRCRPGLVRRHRLVVGGNHRGRRARGGARARRADAVAVFERSLDHRRRTTGAEPGCRAPHDRDRARLQGIARHARSVVRRSTGRHHRGELATARVRGMVLMALSNKFGWLVLTTGNKSEMAVGYTTLYGDMAGGFSVIKDVWKTMVYDVCEYRNAAAGRELIPETVLTKPPSAELRPDQVDTDSLPPYSVLDRILDAYIEDDKTAGDLIDAGEDPELVRRIVRLVDLSEYKRRQAPPGVRVTTKAFGKDRRLPITNLYRG